MLFCGHCVGSFSCPFSPFIVAIVLALSFARSHALLWPLCWFCCFQVFTLYCGHCVGSVVSSFFIIAIHLALLFDHFIVDLLSASSFEFICSFPLFTVFTFTPRAYSQITAHSDNQGPLSRHRQRAMKGNEGPSSSSMPILRTN